MKLLTAQYLDYRPNGNNDRAPSGTCWLRLYTGPGIADEFRTRAIAVVTELSTNRGMSVTNAAEGVRAAIFQLLHDYGYLEVDYDPGSVDLTVYEHYHDLISYPARSASGEYGDRYSRVVMDGERINFWAPATRAGIIAALGAIHNGEEVPSLIELPDEVILSCREAALQ